VKSAIVFPGMGPSVDVAKFMLVNPAARELLARADKVLGYSLFDRCQEAEGDYNEHAQVMFVLACLAFARLADRPDYVAGPSFGGRAAAAYCEVLTVEETIWMTAELARLMSAYFAQAHPDVVTHSFVRVPEDALRRILAELDTWHEVSCYIDADFFMLSLRAERLDWLKQQVAAVGGLSLYTMRPPMHAGIFADLRSRVDSEIFGRLDWADPVIPVIADQDGSVRDTADGVRIMLLDGFVRAVRWPSVVATLRRLRVEALYISGPDTMFGRVPCTTRAFTVRRAGRAGV
jgi:[acyl-carrier-protein] S-malonyltransferase